MRLHNINRAIVVEASNMMTAQHSGMFAIHKKFILTYK